MNIIIIGAGVSGMAAALRFAENGAGRIEKITILEKSRTPGGLLKSARKDEFTWDKGTFKFSETNALCALCPEMFAEISQFSQSMFLNNSFHPSSALMSISLKALTPVEMLLLPVDFLYSYTRTALGATTKNLDTWMRFRLTRGIYAHTNLRDYIQKLQGHHPREISYLLGSLRLPYIHTGTRISTVLRRVMNRPKKSGKKPVRILYPFYRGVGALTERVAELCREKGIEIVFDAEVKEVLPSDSGYGVMCGRNGEIREYKGTHVVSTIPLDELAGVYKKPHPSEIMDAAKKLGYMAMFLTHFMLDREMPECHYAVHYSFESRHRWKRTVSIPVEGGRTAVTVETTYLPGTMSPGPELADEIENDLAGKAGFFTRDRIVERHTSHTSYAYPVLVNGYDRSVQTIKNAVESDSFRTIGRQGEFTYIDSIQAIRRAYAVADEMLAAQP